MKAMNKIRERAAEFYKNADIVITEAEKANIEVADFGLNDIENTGLQLITYINTDRVCAKEMVLSPDRPVPSICIHQSMVFPARRRPSAAAAVRFICM